MRSLRVATLTYPLTPLAETACGGAEQIALTVLRRLRRFSGLTLTCIAARGSVLPPGVTMVSWRELALQGAYHSHRILPGTLAALKRNWQRGVACFLQEHPADVIHDQSGWLHGCSLNAPVLTTLHLARSLYPADFFRASAGFQFQLVSQHQRRQYPDWPDLPVVANGIELQTHPARIRPAEGAAPLLYLGRICPEKAPHLAISLAKQLACRLWVAGTVAPFPSHQQYFREQIAPSLNGDIRWIPRLTLPEKQALLAAAAAVVIPSQVAETSSLTAMEAAASGVPVLAWRSGALEEIVVEGETGWLADNLEDLAVAAGRLQAISPAQCRSHAEANFDAGRMAAEYASLYCRLGA